MIPAEFPGCMELATQVALWTAGIFGASLIVLVFARLKRNQNEIAAMISERYPRNRVRRRDDAAYLIAQESRGYRQSRGNGTLILTDEELFYAIALPKRTFIIPLDTVTGLERVRRMGGQGRVRKFLKIGFDGHDTSPDALGIMLNDIDAWERAIDEARP
jgi:hypothetical protein